MLLGRHRPRYLSEYAQAGLALLAEQRTDIETKDGRHLIEHGIFLIARACRLSSFSAHGAEDEQL